MSLFGTPTVSNVRKLEAKRDVKGLIKALGYQKNVLVRLAASAALGRIGDARAVQPLIAALEDEDEDVREDAAEALDKLGWKPEKPEAKVAPPAAAKARTVSPKPVASPLSAVSGASSDRKTGVRKAAVEAPVKPRKQPPRTRAGAALPAPAGAPPVWPQAVATPMRPAPEPGADSRVVRVFVSSTFRDMGAERDELVKRTFPALRKLCESRGVTWGEVDLRWGVTDEQKAEGQVLPICLAEIRGCRPYFLGLLGERYGWVPDTLDPALVEQESWLAEQAGRSVTELEILHGVLRDPSMADHAFFYLRDPAYVEGKSPDQYREVPTPDDIAQHGPQEAERRAAERQAKLADLKERIRSSGLPAHEDYHDPRALGELVLADLTAVIDGLYPAGSEPPPLEREAAEHEAFARSRAGVYIGRPEYFSRLDAHAAGDGPPLVVLGESGSGKSALLANWARSYRAAHPADLVLLHFIGASPASTDWAAMVRRIIAELSRRFDFEIEIPDEPDLLRVTFANALYTAAARGRVVLVLDALNQLEDREGALDMAWLPAVIPANVRPVLSTLPGRSLAEIERRAYPTLAVAPLEPAERERLIVDYLATYSRALGPALRQRIASGPQCANPLYLRALLDELRLWGEHETLGARIDHYLAATTVDSLYELILARYEADYERDRPHLVRDAFSLLWAARRGLSETELLDLLGDDGGPLPRAYWSPLFLAAESSLTSRSGLLGFFHDYLRAAIEQLYLKDEEGKQEAHLRIADYFAARELGLRKIEELPWQLAQAGAWARLAALLVDPEFLPAAWKADQFEVKAFWAQVEANSKLRMVDAYRPAVDHPQGFGSEHVFGVAVLLRAGGHPEQASALQRHISERFRATGQRSALSSSLTQRAGIFYTQGKPDEAMALYKEAEQISVELGDRRMQARLLNNQANILGAQGRPDEAMALYQETEGIARALGDKELLGTSLSNQASILRGGGRLDEAMALDLEDERVYRETGDRHGLAVSLGEQASIHYARGELDTAMALFREQERLCRDYGDKHLLATSLDSQATIHYTRGDPERAMVLYRQAEQLCREADDMHGLAVSLNNQANILDARGDPDGALRLYEEAELIARKAKDMQGLAAALGNRANLLDTRGEVDGALRLYEEAEKILRDIDDVQRLVVALANHAMVLANAGQRREAQPLAEEAYRLATQHGLFAMAQQIEPILAALGRGSPGSRL